jgi:hypothetical protein
MRGVLGRRRALRLPVQGIKRFRYVPVILVDVKP